MIDTPNIVQTTTVQTAAIRLTIPRSEIRNVMGPGIVELMSVLFELGQLPSATVARTVYHGDYEGLGAAWQEFDAWIVAQGRTPEPSMWEIYLPDPRANSDPAEWRTELNRPLAS